MKILYFIFILACSETTFALDCSKADNTIEIEQCAQIAQSKVDKELNTVYQRVLTMLDELNKDPNNRINADLKNGLVSAQRLWVKFREADCRNVYNFWSNGTIRGLMYTSCMQARAEQRITELKEYEKTN